MPLDNTPMLVTGAGSWGTALAIQIARGGTPVILWGHSPQHMADLHRDRRNTHYLPNSPFPDCLEPITDLVAGLARAGDVLLAVPCKGLRAVLETIQSHTGDDTRLAWACKGVEAGSHKLVHQVVEEICGDRRCMAVVSGPTFAAEVADGLPAAIAVAANDADFAAALVDYLHSGAFRAYSNDDIIGVEIGGAVKNVLAIAAGISDGLSFGANTRAALITRGLAEITRLGVAMGGQRETFTGLAGMGDLVLTCTDDQSRNRRMGLALAQGQSVEEANKAIGQVVEGVRTALEVDYLAAEHAVDMPITHQVARLLKGECEPREAVQALLAREPRQESM